MLFLMPNQQCQSTKGKVYLQKYGKVNTKHSSEFQ